MFISRKRYNELVRRDDMRYEQIEDLKKQNKRLMEETEKSIMETAYYAEQKEQLEKEVEKYKILYLDEIQKRVELANQIRLRMG